MTQEQLLTILNFKIGEELAVSSERCQYIFTSYICNSIVLPCGSSDNGNNYQPHSICEDACRIVEDECGNLWSMLQDLDIKNNDFASCDRVGEVLLPLDYCCINAGIEPQLQNTTSLISPKTTPSSNTVLIVGGVLGSFMALIALVLACLLPVAIYHINTRRKIRRLKCELSLT